MWKWNVGQFFLLSGILLLVLYFATSQVDSPIVYYFCFGVILSCYWRLSDVDWQEPADCQRSLPLAPQDV